ncbi:hypothetical protein D3C77_559290 [compost metagenome]
MGRQFVGVVGHQHVFLADQLPVIAIRCAVEHVHHVVGAQPFGRHDRRVIRDFRCAQHPALTRVIGPRKAGFGGLVDGFMHQVLAARHAFRRSDLAQVVIEAIGLRVAHRRGHHYRDITTHRGELAVGLHHHFRRVVVIAAGAVTDHVVVDGFQARLGNRERH